MDSDGNARTTAADFSDQSIKRRLFRHQLEKEKKGDSWFCSCGFKNYGFRWDCHRCHAPFVENTTTNPPQVSVAASSAGASDFSSHLHVAALAAQAALAKTPPAVPTGAADGVATDQIMAPAPMAAPAAVVGIEQTPQASPEAVAAEQAEQEKISKKADALDSLIRSLEAIPDDQQVTTLMIAKKQERDQLRAHLRSKKPLQVQLRNAIAHRQKLENRQQEILREERDLRIVLVSKQQELGQITTELSAAITQVEELEVKHRAEGLAAVQRGTVDPTPNAVGGFGTLPPQQLLLFQQWYASQVAMMEQQARTSPATPPQQLGFPSPQPVFQGAATTGLGTVPAPITPTAPLTPPMQGATMEIVLPTPKPQTAFKPERTAALAVRTDPSAEPPPHIVEEAQRVAAAAEAQAENSAIIMAVSDDEDDT